MMSFWESEHKAGTYTVNYELFTSDKIKQIKSLIDYIVLEWDASCLEPHLNSGGVHTASMVQVRQPIYKNSSQAWKKFENYLPKNFSKLSP